MKLATAAVLLLGLVVVSFAADDNVCQGKSDGNHKDPNSDGKGFFAPWKCQKYHVCNKNADQVRHCLGWPIIPLKLYDPSTRDCVWFWSKHSCSDPDPK